MFNTSNQYMGEVGQLTLDTLTFIDPTGQASLPQTTFRWQNGKASNFEMGATTFGAIIGPLTFGTGGNQTGRATNFAERTFLSETFGITSSRFGNAAVKAEGTMNKAGSFFKAGFSNVEAPQSVFGRNTLVSPISGNAGWQFRIGFGVKPNSGQSKFHFYVPRTFVRNEFAAPSIQIKQSLYRLGNP